ncbi:DinB family protein [Alkalicoccus halolimnae]|uniref:DinB family protein n=1 Tax=Alkalicoccus halolimnae TaxID=1667239 RepID=A0A5C7FMF2_9BACI|nr:DinB family protein [Alkalicoccus halolimnae]TXF85935.1 DinB family protein [Alkalicoccus halolimnae]
MKYTLAPVSARESMHLLGGVIQTREKLLELIAELDEEDFHHKVHDFPTIAGYALHLAQIEWWWNNMVLRSNGMSKEDRDRFYFQEKQVITCPDHLEKSYLLSRLGEARMQTREFFYALSDQEFRRADLTIVGSDGEEMYSPEWVLYHLLHHESYHLGQMNMLRTWINGQREKWDHFNTPYLSL